MQEITYSLKCGEPDSDSYYRDSAAFADEVLSVIDSLAGPAVEKFMRQMGEDPEDEDSGLKQEHGFELLVLGTLWQVYSGDASGLDKAPGQLLSGLARLRRQGGALKPGIDFIRGIMSTLFLSPDIKDNDFITDPTPEQLDRLLDWLEATGEFNRETERLRIWQDYIAALGRDEAVDLLATAITLAAWFEDAGLEALGRYTANVDNYLSEARPGRYWREDVIFCGRRRVEYHLNMAGAEIMNRIYRRDFISTSKKIVILPACMRSRTDADCKAVPEGGAMHCMGCTGECIVSRLCELGKQLGFKVLIIPHESSLSSSKTKKPLIEEDTGAVGVACVLNLISGGWMMRSMGIPVQCVLLDYCGCKNHWSREGLPTGLNVGRLKRILGQ